MPTNFQLRRGTRLDWEKKNPRLREGEMAYETDSRRYKIGDGFRDWNALPYFIDEATTKTYISEEVAKLQATVAGVSQQDLIDHVESEDPHPVYDDGRSFELLYQNAKV